MAGNPSGISAAHSVSYDMHIMTNSLLNRLPGFLRHQRATYLALLHVECTCQKMHALGNVHDPYLQPATVLSIQLRGPGRCNNPLATMHTMP
jgi:hypothetical protein